MTRIAGYTRAFFLSLAFFLPAVLSPATTASARPHAEAAESIIQKIESQRFNWYGFRAGIEVNLLNGHGQAASCKGSLTYLRMHEKMILSCHNDRKEPLFIFKIDDMRFELFLAASRSLYRGNIFDLEHAGDFDSHLKPFDLYRAIKPLPIPADKVRVENHHKAVSTLWIRDYHQGEFYAGRRLEVNSRGDVFSEIFLTPEGATELEVYRGDYWQFQPRDSFRNTIIFPMQLLIENHENNTKTEIRFTDIDFLWPPVETSFELQYPADTKITNFQPLPAPVRQKYFRAS